MNQLAFVFGLLGNVVSFMVFLAPIPTFYTIFKKKSTQGFQSVPYVVGLFSAMLWIYYAFLKPETTLLITINTVGCFVQSTYICFYLFFASKNARIQTVKLILLLNVVGFGLIIVLTHFWANDSNRDDIVRGMDLPCLFIVCVRRTFRRCETSDTYKKCGVHAISSLIFPNPKCCHVVLLRLTP
ncbi:hypothetical protein ABFX02_04G123000 [Erythranthe guttata]